MTTAEYLILITALLLFAATVIYVRLIRSPRSKGVDHEATSSIFFEPTAISISDGGESEAFDEGQDDCSAACLEVRLKKTDAVANNESEYLDDLEDAAAGLARLMHSSESDREQALENSPEDHQDEILGEEEPVSVESVLGEEVIEQIDRIDSELDALEELVASIEESLEAFSSLGADDLPEAEETDSLAEAA